MNRNWFTRMLLSYVPAFFILSAFLFFVFFKMLSDNNREAATRSNDFVARQAQLVIDSSLAAIDQKITLEMLRNRTIIDYFTEPSVEDLTLQVSVMNVLAELKIANPLIHSIYMYRAKDNAVLNMSTAYAFDQYPDASFIRSALASPNSKWSDLRSYKELQSEAGTPVVTLTRSVTIFSDRYGLIVVNVNASSLQSLVREMYDPAATRLQLRDRAGNDLFAAAAASQPQAQSPGRAEMASSSTSDYTGWSLVSVMNGGRTIHFLVSLFDVWFVLGLVVCLASLLWIVYMTRQNYQPIRKLVAQLRSYSPEEDKPAAAGTGGFAGEFHFINTALENMISQNNSFQLRFQDDLKVKRNFFMYELLEGTRRIRLEEWAEEAGKHGWPETFGKARVAVLEIDGFAAWRRTYTLEEQDEWKRQVERIAADAANAGEGGRAWQLWTGASQLTVILMTPAASAESDSLKRIQDWHARLRSEIPFDLTIGLGEPAEHPDNLHDAYEEALEALRYKAVDGGNRILAYAAAKPSGDKAFGYLKQAETAVELLRLSDTRWRVELRSLFGRMETERPSRTDIEQALSYLIFQLNKAIDGMSEACRRSWSTDILPALHRTLGEAEMLKDIAHAVFESLERFEERKESARQSRTQSSVIRDVKTFIEQEFANPDLSLDYLSEKFGISGKYLSRLFKEEFGLKFVDFLIDLRIRHARQLLAGTNDSIQDIAERLGYSSPISFARTFKKIVGMPPNDYRKENQA